jgi:hypothetical protein
MRKYLLLAVLASAAASATASASRLPFIQDDYARARSQAAERKLPIFVECWAPW